MKKALLLTGLLLVLVAPMTMAASGVSLNWGNACWGDLPQSLMTFACNSNTAPANWKMTCSFMLDSDAPDYINFDTFIEGVSATGAIPDWWKLSVPTDCRGAISLVYTNLAGAYAGGGAAACADPFGGAGTGGGGYGYLVPGVQIQMEGIYTLAAGVPVAGNTESYNNTVTIKNGKTVGAGALSCAGCQTGMVFGLYETDIGLESGQSIRLTEAFPGGNQCIVWQAPFAGQPCNAPVPARNSTWGQVKSLYR